MKFVPNAAILIVLSTNLGGCSSEVEDAVRHELIDAGSAQFRDVERCAGDTKISRGQVNGKNRMGAYTGFEPFFYDGASVTFASSPGFERMMNRCYADLAKETAAPSENAASDGQESEPTDWVTSEDVNPVDDSRTRRATIVADEGSSSMGETISLTIRCQSNQTELYVNWSDYLGDDSHDVYDEWKKVTVRVGSESARTERWGISTDNEATFAPGPIDLIRQMAKADRLVLQATPYNESPVTAVFNLQGIGEAIAPIANECGWKI